MSLYKCLKPLVHALPAEKAHELAIKAMANGLVPAQPSVEDTRLHVEVAGLSLPHPVGLAAGFDKNAETLPHIFTQGFGFVECGTITPKPQAGNPKPRVFRWKGEQAVINRLGFNNQGLEAAISRLRNPRPGVVGANIGKNKDSADAVADYVTCLHAVYAHVDYITVNISSPNTQGLRDLQHADALMQLIEAVHKARSEHEGAKPIFVKIAPDVDDAQLEDIARIALQTNLDGLIVSNTTISRPEHLPASLQDEAGGLSGRPLFALSTERLKRAYQLTEGKIPLIGVGGIASPEDAYGKIRAGASAVQLYSALVYQGFDLITQIKRGLVACLERDGLASIQEAVGRDG